MHQVADGRVMVSAMAIAQSAVEMSGLVVETYRSAAAMPKAAT